MYYVCNSVNLFTYDNYRLDISEQVQYEYVKVPTWVIVDKLHYEFVVISIIDNKYR